MESRGKQYITIKDAWSYLASNVWLFIISIVISLSVAFGYVVITPPIYKRTASILIKSDEQTQAVSSVLSLSGNNAMTNSNIDLNNEVNVLRMPQLMEEVAQRLSLQDSYSVKFRDLRWVDIYRSAPFQIKLDSLLSSCRVSLEMEIDDEDNFSITDLSINGSIVEEHLSANFGDEVSTSYGSFTVERAPWFKGVGNSNLYSYSHSTAASAAAKYSGALSVWVRGSDVSIIDLSMTGQSRERMEDILNTLISVYNENWIKDRNLITISTTNFINERVKIIEQELGAVEQNISSYKSENLLSDVGAASNMNLQSSNEILKEQVELNNQLSMARYILQHIQNSTTESQLLPVNTGIENSSIENQVAQYNELLLRKNNLLAHSSVNNPVIADMINELQGEKSAIVTSINGYINTLNFQIENSRKEEMATRNRLTKNNSQELYLLSSGREQMVKEQLYLFLLQKREENELNQAFTAYNTKVLSYAHGSNIPIEPKRNIILLMGLAIGLIVPIVILILRESFNTAIRDKSDLKGLSIPYLGAIPYVGSRRGFLGLLKKGGVERESIVVCNNRDVVNESFRVVRTNLDFMLSGSKKSQCIAITSINPGSGKSFISLNIGASLALKNSRTLVIDTDFRRGTLSEVVDSPEIGLVNWLNSEDLSIDEIIVKGHKYPMLDILPMGVMPPNPTELLLLDKFATIIKEFRERYDYIIFDCPPVDIVSDAAIVERECDSTIFILRAGLTDKTLLPELESFYTDKKYKKISMILNAVDYNKNRKYGYGGYGKYGYGNYYGYGNKGKK